MMNIWIRWYCGYSAYVGGDKIYLRRGKIYFYKVNGDISDVVECNLQDSVQFDMRVNCSFRFTRPHVNLNFSKGDVFAVHHKGGEYDLYIPMNEVDFKKLDKRENVINNGMDVMVMRRCAFNATDLTFWNPSCNHKNFFRVKGSERLNFLIHIKQYHTDKGKMIDEIVQSLYNDCGVSISSYDMVKIVEKYKIEKI